MRVVFLGWSSVGRIARSFGDGRVRDHLKTFPFQDGYKLSACALNETFCKEVIILDIYELIHLA